MPEAENPLADRIPKLSQSMQQCRIEIERLPSQIAAMQTRLDRANAAGKQAAIDLRAFTGVPSGAIGHAIIKGKIPNWPGGDDDAQLVEVRLINSNITYIEALP